MRLSTVKAVMMVSCVVVTSASLVPMAFTSLESSKTQKIVIFHDPSVEDSLKKLGVLESLDSAGTYGTEYQFTVCDVTTTENFGKIKAAGMSGFPVLFTQTLEGGIEPFPGDLTIESFAAFHEFRKMDISGDKVQRMKDMDGNGDVDDATAMLSLAAERPVFVKMYEVTPHTP
jgi:hypothetical protein